MGQISLTLRDEAESCAVARKIAGHLRPGDTVLLNGEMAAGKTFMVREIVQALGSDDHVSSPSYTIVQQYEAPSGPIIHIDAHRLEDEAEFHDLALEGEAHSILLIEWGGRIAGAFDEPLHMSLKIDPDNPKRREVTIGGALPHWRSVLEVLRHG